MRILRTVTAETSLIEDGQAVGAEANDIRDRDPFFPMILKSLRSALWLVAAWLVLFQLMRALLVFVTWTHHGDATVGLIVQSMLHGLRFDLSIAAAFTVPFALWRVWRGSPGRLERRAVFCFFSLLSLAGIFALIAEVEFYKEFQMRLGPLVFEYFSTNEEHNTIIAGMIWHGYPVVRWTLVCLAVCAGFAWVARRWFGARDGGGRLPVRLVATVLLAGATVLMVRGGWRGIPLQWGDAFFSSNTYANHMAVNGVWAVLDCAFHAAKGNKEAKKWKHRLPESEAIQLARELILLPGETLVDPDQYPLLRVSPPNDAVVKRPGNVVLVMMESFTARFNDAVGADFGATPNFAALAREGILFDRAFSVSTHTAPGVFGTLCSFPILPDYNSVMKLPLGQQTFRSLPRLFEENGYETLFLYNGLFSWDNKEGFFRHQGMQRFIGRDEFVNPTFVDPDWGVCDLDVFNRAIEEFNALAAKKKKFFSVILTLSNHSPFNLPKVEGLEEITAGGEQNRRLNGVHYADWAVGQFMAAARKQEWFDDTLFVFVGDHGFGIPPNLTEVSLLHMHVPLLFYAPALFGGRHEVRHQTVGQEDILPSIVGLTGLSTPHQAFGRDVFRLPADDPGQTYVKRSGEPMLGWITGDEILVGSLELPSRLYKVNLGFPPDASEDLAGRDPALTAEATRKLNAIVVTALHTLEKRLAAPTQ